MESRSFFFWGGGSSAGLSFVASQEYCREASKTVPKPPIEPLGQKHWGSRFEGKQLQVAGIGDGQVRIIF